MRRGSKGVQRTGRRIRLLRMLGIGGITLSASTAWAAFGLGPVAALNANAGTDSGHDNYPLVATDGAGNWVAVFDSGDSLGGTIGTDSDILVTRSTDNGATWTSPVALNTNAATDSGSDFGPKLVTDGAGNWIVAWNSDDTLGATIGSDWDILMARSTDNGATWTAPVALNSNAATDSGGDFLPRVATDGAGIWVAVWQSGDSLGGTIGLDDDILVARSTDNGATWSSPAPLNSTATTDLETDNYPSVATDGMGNWVAVWESTNTLGGTIGLDMDILASRSTDGGATWTSPAAVNTHASTDSSYDVSADVATDGAGNWVVVWETDETLGGTIGTDMDILVARSTDNGVTWTAPAALNTNAATDSGYDGYACVTTDSAGNWVAAWQSTDTLGGTIGAESDILAARSTDNGATWSAPEPTNSNAAIDTGHDIQPQVTTDGAGNWIVVCQSYDSLGGTIGTDSDILFAISGDITLPVELDVFGVE